MLYKMLLHEPGLCVGERSNQVISVRVCCYNSKGRFVMAMLSAGLGLK